jgi:hypothetical protein
MKIQTANTILQLVKMMKGRGKGDATRKALLRHIDMQLKRLKR